MPSSNKLPKRNNAPFLLGAFFFVLLSCGIAVSQEKAEDQKEVVFLAYNLKNYLTMSRYTDGERIDRFKPEEEIEAVVQLLAKAKPDLLGLCEIGTKEELKDLQTRLKKAGLDLPHSEHTGGSDSTRHLAFLSRFPITETNSQRDLFFTLEGERMPVRRGILDVTVKCHDRDIRFLGVHLKSKREIRDADQEMIRRNEAYMLRKHADEILTEDEDTLLVAYGDFNDTRRSTAVRSITSARNARKYLEPLLLEDERGDVWTHYWDYQHIYSRFDYVLVSRALSPLVVPEKSFIIDDANWKTASDHRATQATFRW